MSLPALSDLWSWATTLMAWGGGAAVAIMLLAAIGISLPFLNVVTGFLNALMPAFKAIVEALVGYVSTLWRGFMHMIDASAGGAGIVLMLTLVGGTMLWDGWKLDPTPKSCGHVIEELRRDYKMTPRTEAEKRAYLKSKESKK